MKVFLLDINVLLALTWRHHVHHDIAHRWWEQSKVERWASCSITQLGFIRLSCHPQIASVPTAPARAVELLRRLVSRANHEFWPECPGGIGTAAVAGALSACLAASQVTDAYLARLALHHGGCLATLDRPLVARHPEVAVLVE